MSPGFKRRIPLLIALAIGFVAWRSGFGFFAVERTLTWRLPVSHSQVQRVELQVWDGEALLKRQEFQTDGLTAEPQTKITLSRGPHRAVALVWLSGAPQPRTFQLEFDPTGERELLLDFAAR